MHLLYTLIPLSRSCSSVWLERLPVTQEVAGSNPVSSAKKPSLYKNKEGFFNWWQYLQMNGREFQPFFLLSRT